MLNNALYIIRNGVNRIVGLKKDIQEKSLQKKEAIYRAAELKRLKRVHNTDRPAYTHCQNCGEALNGMYCHCCGQYASDINESFFKLIMHYFDNSFSYDGRLWITLKLLFLRPGFLPAEYSKGRMASYMHPFKMYMFCSFFFFFLFFTFTVDSDTLLATTNTPNQSGIIIQSSDGSTTKGDVNEIEVYKKLKEKFFPLFKSYAPIGMFFLMPVFAFIQMAAFRKKKYPYMSHLIFSINIHTIMLLLFSLGILLSLITEKLNYEFIWDMNTILIGGLTLYIVLAAKSFYGYTWRGTLVRVIVNMSIYTFLIVFLFLALLVAGIVYM